LRLLGLPLVDSTNAEAWRRLEAGESPPFMLTAGSQTAGRGREGRPFHSPPGGGLWASIACRTDLPPSKLPAFGVALGVVAAEALREITGLEVTLRWPNDLMLGPLKLGGILAESRDSLLVLGLGINLTLGKEDFPPELRDLATSVKAAGGRPPEPEDLLMSVSGILERDLADLEAGREESLLRRWRTLCRTLGRPVRVAAGRETVDGTLSELDLDRIVVGGRALAAGHVRHLTER